MDVFTKILEQFGAVFRLRDELSSLANTNPFLAGVIIFVIAIIIGNAIVSQAIELKKRLFGEWKPNALAWAGLISGLSLAALVSAGTVLNLREATAPVPILDKNPDLVVGRPLVLKWDYGKKNARFEIQNSEDSDFRAIDTKTTGDGAFFPANNINGKRFWRVREVDVNDKPISPWSRPISIVQYETSWKRIQQTRNVSVYISNSFNEGFFKFDVRKDGKRQIKGYDIAIIEEVIKELTPLLQIDGPLSYSLTPVSWSELLGEPEGGRADVIISSITSYSEREEDFGIKFSDPYYCTTQSLIYRPPQSSKSVLEMIEKKRVGVQGGTTSQDIMMKFKSDVGEDRKFELKEYDQAGSMVDALMDHRIDVGLTDTPFARAAQWQYGTDKLVLRELRKEEDFPRELEPERRFERYAIAVRDGEKELTDAINKIIGQMREKKLAGLLEKEVVEFYATQGGAPRNLPMFDRKADPSSCDSE